MELCLVLCTKDVNCFAKERCQISTAESIYIIGKTFITDIELPQVEQNLIITATLLRFVVLLDRREIDFEIELIS